MLRSILRDKRRCLYVLPFVAIVQEKASQLSNLYKDVNIKVEAMYSGSEVSVWSPRIDICICTLEKANAIATQLLTSQKSASMLQTFVFDEFHLVSDPHRGHSLESLIIKLKLAHFRYPNFNYQIIAMSATISAPEKLAHWLQADTFEGESRPATLFQYFKIGKCLYSRDMEHSVKLDLHNLSPLGTLPNKVKVNHAQITALSSFYLAKKKPIIVFCSTKQECHTLALSMAQLLPRQFDPPSSSHFSTLMEELKQEDFNQRSDSLTSPFEHVKVRSLEEVEKRKSLIKALAQTPARLCGILKQTVPMGVAYHNSNLSSEERELIEQAYRQKVLLVLCATSTLSTGVNLPTKAVIFTRPRIGRDLIDFAHYKQMSGRAGRTGFDTSGDSIMICTMDEKRKLDHILSQKERTLVSAMNPLQLCSSVLELIRLRIISHQNHLISFLKQSLLYSLTADSHCSKCSSVKKQGSSLTSAIKNIA